MTEKVHLVLNSGLSGLAITRYGDLFPTERGVTSSVAELLKTGHDLTQSRGEIKILTAVFSATT
jgi:hypothetical protein